MFCKGATTPELNKVGGIMIKAIASSAWVDQQGIGHIGRRTPLIEQNKCVDQIGLAHVPGGAVGRTQFGEFVLVETVVQHEGCLPKLLAGYPPQLNRNLT